MLFPFLPDIKYANNKRWLINRIIKKQYVNRPEERVRLGVLEQLLAVAAWSTQRVGFEIMTKHETSDLLRTDLIAYNKKFEPEILIECKAPEIKINEAVIKQAFRYNQQLNASWVICTNGAQFIAFQRDTDSKNFAQKEVHPLSTSNFKALKPTDDFYKRKGFLGNKPVYATAKEWLSEVFTGIKALNWLDLPLLQPNQSFSHFYAQWPTNPKLWYSFMGLADESSWLVFVDAANNPAKITALCVSLPTQANTAHLPLLRYANGKWENATVPIFEFENFIALEAFKDFLL